MTRDGGGPGERLRRRRQRRRLVREEMLAVAILVIALAVTLVVLGLQWVGSGQSVTPTTVRAPAEHFIGGLYVTAFRQARAGESTGPAVGRIRAPQPRADSGLVRRGRPGRLGQRGEDTIILSVGEVLAITDAFVITSGSNPRQVRTIAEEVEEQLKRAGGPAPLRIEGLDDARWVLMDFGDFVVHVMLTDVRDFYQLERLWADSDVWSWREGEALAAGE